MANLAFIPIRSGSKSIPGKNIREFCGKPLVNWLIEALENSDYIQRIVIALDGEEQEQIVKKTGAKKLEIYRRMPENAKDNSSTESVMLEFLEYDKTDPNDVFILLQATSPFTRTQDINRALELFKTGNADSVLSAIKTKRFFWDKHAQPINYDYRNRPRRQDFDGLFMENGAIYISTTDNILKSNNRLSGKISVFEMPEYTGIEIDEPADWEMAEALFKRYQPERLRKKVEIRLVLSDVDGVLTDAGMYYSEKGDELKKFSTYDGMGFKMLQQVGIKVGIITGENRKLNAARADKLNLDYAFHGIENKLINAQELCNELGISLQNLAYIGDDINDVELLKNVGLAACPANAVKKVKDIFGIIELKSSGGNGALREFAEIILQ
jgi:YrbI family 3-deoxy-D-manno-octulosonate 8-phosphate phosphatase